MSPQRDSPAPHDDPPAVDTAAIRERHRACTPDQHVFGAGATVCDVPTLLAELDRLRADYAATVAERDAAEGVIAEYRARRDRDLADNHDLTLKLDDLRRQLDAALEAEKHQHSERWIEKRRAKAAEARLAAVEAAVAKPGNRWHDKWVLISAVRAAAASGDHDSGGDR